VVDALVIASALAVPDPRERPLERAQAADQAHLKFRDERSDFLSLIALWQFFADALAEKLSHRKLVERCRAQFVSNLRLREWRDVHDQLATELGEAGWQWNPRLPDNVDVRRYAVIHQALLAGLLSNVGIKAEDGAYEGARGIRFHLHPGSGIARKAPFLERNRRLIAEIAEFEHKARRQDVLVDDDTISAFYAERIPPDVSTRVAFERWRTQAEGHDPKLLLLTREFLMRHVASNVTEEL